jgi:CopA family copper-resistance protein
MKPEWPMTAAINASVSRRRFVQGLAGGALLLAGARPWAREGSSGAPSVLSGTDFRLDIGATGVNITGSPRIATAVNGQVPAPVLYWREGDEVTLRVTNRLAVPSSIHWHGLIVPADMDGVPGLSFDGIAPGETFQYRFKVNQYGTYWYHAHSRFQEQTGLYGPIVIVPRDGERHPTQRDHTVLLSDWTDIDPEHLYRTLKRKSNYFNFNQRTVGDFIRDARSGGLAQAVADRRMWGEMRMSPTDLADVSGYAYTYLMNGAAPAANWTGVFQRGEKVRLRFINGSAMSIFDVRIPGLKLTVVAADGQDVEPVTVDEFRIATAEVYDVIVEPKDDRAYTIFAQSIDRTGYARGTLAPRAGMEAEIPPLDPVPLLTMADMGMAHDMGGMPGMHDMSGMSGMAGMKGMEGMQHDSGAGESKAAPEKMDHDSMPGMDHGAKDPDMPSMDHSKMDHSAMDHGAMDHSTMDHSTMDHSAMGHSMEQSAEPHHAPAEYGPTVDNRAMQPSTRLDDPGIGLRNNGRRVLTYADLHTLGGPIDRREPGREIELHLTGHMERFIWSFNGQKFSEAEPLRFNHGERLRIILVNDSMMTHPIHLHGMWSEVETPEGEFLVRKHTVTVQPGQRVSYAVTADALGRWAYHCHLLYHMEAGMFREVHVAHGADHGGHS